MEWWNRLLLLLLWMSLLVFAYVDYVCVFVSALLFSSFVQCLYLLIWHLLFVLFVWSLVQTVSSPFPRPPAVFELSNYTQSMVGESYEYSPSAAQRLLRQLARDRGLPTQSDALHVCRRCGLLQPERCSHCSVCGICLLSRGQHNRLLNVCVHANNRKAHALSLVYGCLLAAFAVATALPVCILEWTELRRVPHNVFVSIGLVLAILFFFITLPTVFQPEAVRILTNRTYQEVLDGIRHFDKGKRANLVELCGKEWMLWMLPINTNDKHNCAFERATEHKPDV